MPGNWMGGFYLWLKKPELGVEHPLVLSADRLKCSDRPSLGSCPCYRATASGTGTADVRRQE